MDYYVLAISFKAKKKRTKKEHYWRESYYIWASSYDEAFMLWCNDNEIDSLRAFRGIKTEEEREFVEYSNTMRVMVTKVLNSDELIATFSLNRDIDDRDVDVTKLKCDVFNSQTYWVLDGQYPKELDRFYNDIKPCRFDAWADYKGV